jgi:hypothetical protein
MIRTDPTMVNIAPTTARTSAIWLINGDFAW